MYTPQFQIYIFWHANLKILWNYCDFLLCQQLSITQNFILKDINKLSWVMNSWLKIDMDVQSSASLSIMGKLFTVESNHFQWHHFLFFFLNAMRDAEALRSRTRLLLKNKKQNTFNSENNLKSTRVPWIHKEKMSKIH